MIKRKIKRLWNGLASLRDYEVEDAISKNEPIELTCNNETMILPVFELKRAFQATTIKHKSKYNPNQRYALVDFRWKPKINDKGQDEFGFTVST